AAMSGRDVVVACELPKLVVRVRFPPPAPIATRNHGVAPRSMPVTRQRTRRPTSPLRGEPAPDLIGEPDPDLIEGRDRVSDFGRGTDERSLSTDIACLPSVMAGLDPAIHASDLPTSPTP